MLTPSTHTASFIRFTGSDCEGEDLMLASPFGYPLELCQYMATHASPTLLKVTQTTPTTQQVILTLSNVQWLEWWVEFANFLWSSFAHDKYLTVRLDTMGDPILHDGNMGRTYQAFTHNMSDLTAITQGFFPTIFFYGEDRLWLHYGGLATLSKLPLT